MTYRLGSPPSTDHQQACLYCGKTCFEGATACACGAPAPPVRVSLPEALWCARCGGHRLGPAASSYGQCCTSCGGRFVDVETWTRLLATSRAQEVTPRPDADAAPLSQAHLSYPSRCPACGERMERAVFADRSGVTVDVCHAHGIWFDARELPSVIAWLDSGSGLTLRRLPST